MFVQLCVQNWNKYKNFNKYIFSQEMTYCGFSVIVGFDVFASKEVSNMET